MSSDYPLRELNSPSAGWAQISLDFGRDEAFCEIEDESLILAAAGLMVAGLTACLSKDDNWLSRKEVLRAVIPGTHETKLSAANALCEVGLWIEEERGGVRGWRLGVETALSEKRKRIENATRAANARHSRAKKPIRPQVFNEASEEDDPWA
jgi:hypothetical protein